MDTGPGKGTLFIISAPSGAGKTSLARALVERVPGLQGSVSHTTRAPRKDEQDGRDYHFVSEQAFQSLIARDSFLEYARVFDHYYGTTRAWVEEQLATGTDIILDIDWQGAQQARTLICSSVGVFILPPSLPVLRQRLQGRGDTPQSIRRRMQDAVNEIEHCRDYDYIIVNDNFDRSLEGLSCIVRAARRRYLPNKAHYETLLASLLQSG